MRAGTCLSHSLLNSQLLEWNTCLLVEKRGRKSGGEKNPTRPMRNLNFSIGIRRQLFCRHVMRSLLSARGVSEDYTQRTVQWQMCNGLLWRHAQHGSLSVCRRNTCSPSCLKGQHGLGGHVARSQESGQDSHLSGQFLTAWKPCSRHKTCCQRDSLTFLYNGKSEKRLKNWSILGIRKCDPILPGIWVTGTN